MRGSRTTIAAVGAASLALVLGGCGSSNAGSGLGPDGAVVAWCTPQNSLVGTNTNETCGGYMLQQISSALFRYDPKTSQPVKDLAESLTANGNNTVFTVKIRNQAEFSDGTDVKAKNFVDAWNYGAYGPNGQLEQSFFEPIKGFDEVSDAKKPKAKTMSGLKVTGDKSFTITTAEPTSNLIVRLGFSAYAPQPDAFFKDPKGFGDKPIGAGPYKVESYDRSQNLVMVKNENYGGAAPKGNLEKLNFKFYQDLDAAYNDLQGGNVDLFPQPLPVSAMTKERYKDDLQGRYDSATYPSIQALGFAPASTDPTMNNPTLRHAISLAIDRKKIVKDQFFGLRVPASGWVAPGVVGYKAGACGDLCTYNPTKAKELFKQSGYKGKLTIGYNADADHKPWVTATCASIQQTLGVQCVPTPYTDFATFRSKVTAHTMKGMHRAAWVADYPSIENFLTQQYATGGGSNDSKYSDPAFDKLLKQAGAAKGEQANADYQKAEKSLAAKMPAIPLWYYQTVVGWSDKVTDVKVDKSTGYIDLLSVKAK